jgi:hypothetical protein
MKCEKMTPEATWEAINNGRPGKTNIGKCKNASEGVHGKYVVRKR